MLGAAVYNHLGSLIDQDFALKSQHSLQTTASAIEINLVFPLTAQTSLPSPDHGDQLYMNASTKCLQTLNAVSHGALRFVTGCARRTPTVRSGHEGWLPVSEWVRAAVPNLCVSWTS